MGDLFVHQISQRVFALETYVSDTNDALLEQIGAVDGAAKATGQEALRRIGLAENALGKLKPDVSELLTRVGNVERTNARFEEVVSEVASNVVAEIVRDQKLVTAGALQECVNSVVGRSASLERQLATLDERITGHVGQVRNDVTALQQRSDSLESGIRDCKTALEDAQRQHAGRIVAVENDVASLRGDLNELSQEVGKDLELGMQEHVAAKLAEERAAIEKRARKDMQEHVADMQEHVAAKLAEERAAIEERARKGMQEHVATKLAEERAAIEERARRGMHEHIAAKLAEERAAIEERARRGMHEHVATKLAEERVAIEERARRGMHEHVAAKLAEERTANEERAWTNVEKRVAQLVGKSVTDALSTFRAEHERRAAADLTALKALVREQQSELEAHRLSADDVAALKALVTKQRSEIEALRGELGRRRGEVEPREREYPQTVWTPHESLREDNDAGVPSQRLDGGVNHAAQGALALEGAEPGEDGHGDDTAASHGTPGAGPDASDVASAHELPQGASDFVAENAADVSVALAGWERRTRSQTEHLRRFFEEAAANGKESPRKTAHSASVQDVTMTAADGSPSAPSASGSLGMVRRRVNSFMRKRALPADGSREERPAKRREERRELADVGGSESGNGTSASEIEMVPARPSDDTPISQLDIKYLGYASLNDLRRLRDHLKTLPKASVKRACDEDLQQWTGDPSEVVVDARKRLPFPKGPLIVNGAIWSDRYARAYESLALRLRDVEKVRQRLDEFAAEYHKDWDVGQAACGEGQGDLGVVLGEWIASQEGDAVVAPSEDSVATLGLTADAFVSLLGFWTRPLESLAMARIEHDFVRKAGLAVKIQTVASYNRVADVDVALGATVVVGATYANWRRWCVLECRAVGGRGGHCTRTALVPVVTGKAEGLQQALEECGYGVTMVGGDKFKSSSKTTKMVCDEGLFHCLELVLKRAKGSGVATQLESATRKAFLRMYYACAWRAFQSRGEPDQPVDAPYATVSSPILD